MVVGGGGGGGGQRTEGGGGGGGGGGGEVTQPPSQQSCPLLHWYPPGQHSAVLMSMHERRSQHEGVSGGQQPVAQAKQSRAKMSLGLMAPIPGPRERFSSGATPGFCCFTGSRYAAMSDSEAVNSVLLETIR